MKTLFEFSYNWNNKLDCEYLTTFRLSNPRKHVVGAESEIYLKGRLYKYAVIVDVKSMTLDKVNPFIAGLDTGYDVENFKKIIRNMYKKKVPDPDKALYDLILLRSIER